MDEDAAAVTGDAWAEVYDDQGSPAVDPKMIDTLTSLVLAGGRMLELGVGTGRVAGVLGALGYRVTGIDVSPGMLEVARAKQLVNVTLLRRNFHEPIVGKFGMAFAVFNTFLYAGDQRGQVEFLRNVREALDPGGHLVLEYGEPYGPLSFGGSMSKVSGHETGDLESAHLLVTNHRVVEQKFVIRHVMIGLPGLGVQVRPADCRYVWPSELTLMAELAGYSVESLSSDWSGSPLHSRSALLVADLVRRV